MSRTSPMFVAVAAACLSGTAFAAPLLQEDWENETVGDNLSQLANWTLTAGDATLGAIQDVGGNRVLAFSELTASNSRTLYSATTYSLGSDTTFKVSLKMRDTSGLADPGGFIVAPASTASTYRVEYNGGGSGTVRIKRGSASLVNAMSQLDVLTTADIRTAMGGGSTWKLGDESVYELVVAIGASKTDLTLSINGTQVFSGGETTGRITFDGTSGKQVQLGLFGWNKNGVIFDDISLTSVPEPAALGVLGLAALPLMRRRRA